MKKILIPLITVVALSGCAAIEERTARKISESSNLEICQTAQWNDYWRNYARDLVRQRRINCEKEHIAYYGAPRPQPKVVYVEREVAPAPQKDMFEAWRDLAKAPPLKPTFTCKKNGTNELKCEQD